jgi:uncharacterized protein with NAD-binding domain and iron-sulfur cluster
MKTVAILGGGLAGLTVAKQLQTFGFRTVVYERSSTLGGKASSFAGERPGGDDVLYEHGYHFFAGWYVNTRRLLRDLGIRGLIDFDRWHYLEPLQHGKLQLRTLTIPRSSFDLATMWRTLRSAPASIPQTLLYLYFLLDTAGERLYQESTRRSAKLKTKRAVLDRVSRTGLLRSRWYATPTLAELDLQNTLKASAIPAHDMSAFTVKKLQDVWFANLTPFLSVLDGDLQTKFIDPFSSHLSKLGVEFKIGHRVTALNALQEGQLKSVTMQGPDGTYELEADVFVMATPLEVTRQLLTKDLLLLDPQLGHMHQLRAEPMASLHLRLKRKLELPREHVIFGGNQYGLSFVDQSTLWPAMPEASSKSYLSFISAQFIALVGLPQQEQFDVLMSEIVKYVPISLADVEHWELRSNVDAPLFVNTTGAWTNRPCVTSAVPNLFFAGDWVKNDIDLACMEGAVSAALDCAHEICRQYRGAFSNAKVPAPARAPRRFGETKAWFLSKLFGPGALGLWLWTKFDEFRTPGRG